MLEKPGHGICNARRLSGPLAANQRLLEARGLSVAHLRFSDWRDGLIDNESLLKKVSALYVSGDQLRAMLVLVSGA